jgi:YaaC-like Protein
MRHAINRQVTAANSRSEAISYIDQAKDFYASALGSSIDAAKPVQLYYSYLNIAKAFIIARGIQPPLPNIQHGINEAITPGGQEFQEGCVKFWRSPNPRRELQAFDEFMKALDGKRLANGQQCPIMHLIPQILSGHRLWADAASKTERFIALQRIQFIENKRTENVWLRMYLFADDIKRLGYTQNDVLVDGQLVVDFRKVRCTEKADGRGLICIDQSLPSHYGRHGVDLAMDLVAIIRERLWATVGSSPPYRRYYLYLCPAVERDSVLPQLASIYAMTFYLGSVTRYRPNTFRALLDGPYGPRIAEFVSGQPAQFVYLMASQFSRRDITRPSIV